jgi:hypothetical protein
VRSPLAPVVHCKIEIGKFSRFPKTDFFNSLSQEATFVQSDVGTSRYLAGFVTINRNSFTLGQEIPSFDCLLLKSLTEMFARNPRLLEPALRAMVI